MAVRFSVEQVVQATGAKRLMAGSRSSFAAICTDTRALTPGCLFVALKGERFDAHTFLAQAAAGGASGAVVQAGEPLPELHADFALFQVPDTLAALGALARFHRRRFKIPVVAVTGSNGKTTTKEMVAAILATRGPALKTEGNLNNEVGVPLTLFGLLPQHQAAVIEMGMNHAGEIARLTAIAEPTAGVITVVQAAHLKGLGNLQGVAAAKGELFAGLAPSATAVVNVDEPLIVAEAKKGRAATLTFGRAAGADVQLTQVVAKGAQGLELTLRVKGADHRVALAMVGAHNAHNATAAFALCTAVGFTPAECIRGLEAARPHPRRLNVVQAPGGVVVIDDCYNANPGSMSAALQTLQELAPAGRAFAVVGDMLELGDEEAAAHQALGKQAAAAASAVAFFGPRSAQGHQAAAMGPRAAHFTEIAPLLSWLKPQLKSGDVVLVKGSRGMKLERVVEGLTGQPSGGGH